MPVTLPEPDDVDNGPHGATPLWRCPHCKKTKPIEEFGWRSRNDIYPDQNVWHKQSWCRQCRGEK
jgi:hypothetical protein